MIRRPPRSTRTDTLFPYTTLFRSSPGGTPSGSSRPTSASCCPGPTAPPTTWRSEEHTSELQSLMRISYAVFCLKKKNNKYIQTKIIIDLCTAYFINVYKHNTNYKNNI